MERPAQTAAPYHRGIMADAVKWERGALERLKKVPFFVRPWVKKRAEAAARERGVAEVTSALLDEIKRDEHKG